MYIVGETSVQVLCPFKKIISYFWLFRVFTAACGLSLAVAGGATVLQSMGCLLQWFLLWSVGIGAQASVVAAHGLSSCGSQVLEHRLNICGAWT